MRNTYFKFKEFTVHQSRSAMKVTTDSCAFGAWVATDIQNSIYDARISSSTVKVCDIGTGTGLLSLMIAQKNDVMVDAIEINGDAVVETKENFAASKWPHRLHAHHQDVRLVKARASYDFVVANPPFHEKQLLSPSKARQEAHHSGSLTLAGLFEIMDQILTPTGSAYVLLPFYREEEGVQQGARCNLFINKAVHLKPTLDHQPIRFFLKFIREETHAVNREELIIKEHGQYTKDFFDLLSDYYL